MLLVVPSAGWSHVMRDWQRPSRLEDYQPSLLEDWTRENRDEVVQLLDQRVHHATPLRTGTAIGKLALKLRQHFCGSEGKVRSLTSPPLSPTGETCVMRRLDSVARFFPAFAALSPGSPGFSFMEAFWRNEF